MQSTHLSGNTKASQEEKKAFLLGKKSKQLSHICIYVCERMYETHKAKVSQAKLPVFRNAKCHKAITTRELTVTTENQHSLKPTEISIAIE